MSNQQKIQDIIKLVKELSFGEIIELNTALMEALGIDASMLAGPAGGSSSSAAPAEEVVKNVMLVEIKSKIGSIKGIRAKLGVSLGDASTLHNDVVAGKPLLLQENAKAEDLKACQALFVDEKGEITGVLQLVAA